MINIEVSKKQTDCMKDLAKAEPALKAAQAALDTLNKVGYIENWCGFTLKNFKRVLDKSIFIISIL